MLLDKLQAKDKLPAKLLTGQKSSSLIVPSKESAMQSKQLLTGAQAIDKQNDVESVKRDAKGIRSFVEESKLKKSLISPFKQDPLPSAVHFTS